MSSPPERLAAALSQSYRLERELGQGGMATVYLAQDLKHDRKVAIKVLRPELAAVIGAERFLREIKTIATLQHPHILGLIDSGEVNGSAYYVMPFVEGESLRDRLSREKQLPVHDAVRLASEIAGALDYAHRHAVIHRDIKPENVLLHDGRALVADFGIALAVSSAGGGTRMTETGMSLGTPHYMSPEQAMGEREITARSDVYALGCVTYEMLAGEPPFTGPTAQAIIAKVMTTEPVSLTSLRKSVPPEVDGAVRIALEKLPADRFATAAEFAAALTGVGSATRRLGASSVPGRAAVPPRRRVVAVAALLLTAAAAFAAGRGMRGRADGPSVYDAALPDSAPVSFAASTSTASYGNSLRNLSVTARGDFAVYAAREGASTAAWYRSLRDGSAHAIPGTSGATVPRVSPDGSRVAFLVGDRAFVVPTSGGVPRLVLDGQNTGSVDWTSNHELLIGDNDGVRVNWVDADGGAPRSKALPRCTFWSRRPDTGELLCTANGLGLAVDPESGKRSSLSSMSEGRVTGALSGSAFRLVAGRYLVYLAWEGSLVAARYDPETHTAGRPVTLLTGVRREPTGEAQFDLSDDGTLVYAPGVDATIGRMVHLSPSGEIEPLSLPPDNYQRYDLSRDRRWFAASAQGPDGSELRIYDLRNGQRFTWLKSELIRHPFWSADGSQLLFALRDSTRWSILRGSPSSGRPPDTLASYPVDPSNPDVVDWHDDHLAIAQDWGIQVSMQFDPSRRPVTFDTLVTGARFGSLSPNGRLLLYQAFDGNRVEVTGYPGLGRRWQLSSSGTEPFWLSPTEVLFRLGVSWYAVRVNPETGEPAGPPTYWGRDPRFSDTSGWSQRPSHDGGIIYMQGPEETTATYLRVIPGWVAQMKAAVDSAGR